LSARVKSGWTPPDDNGVRTRYLGNYRAQIVAYAGDRGPTAVSGELWRKRAGGTLHSRIRWCAPSVRKAKRIGDALLALAVGEKL
jgi:hypothetical protein